MIYNGGFEILEENDHVTVAEGDYAAGFARYGSHGSTGLLSDDMARCGTCVWLGRCGSIVHKSRVGIPVHLSLRGSAALLKVLSQVHHHRCQ